MSILNQHEDKSFAFSKDLFDRRSDYFDDIRSSYCYVENSKIGWKVRPGRQTLRDYQQYSQRLRSRDSHLPISDSKLKQLESSLQSGSRISSYIPRLMTGKLTSRVTPRNNATISPSQFNA